MRNKVLGWITNKREDKLALLDIFAASGLTTIFLTRAYLALMNYPQLGGETLHIAHMLWGGLLLTVVTLYLALVNRPNKKTAVFFGGIGFGLFIDELGKFITVDNDYFFKPAASLIILLFILIWVSLRVMIARHENKPVLPPAEWPKRRIEIIYVYGFLALSTLSAIVVPLTAWLSGSIEDLTAGYTIAGALYVVYGLTLAVIWGLIWKKKSLAAATLTRVFAVVSILILSPINFYIDQFAAATEFIAFVLLIIATSRDYDKT